jgi:hypothetical protein
LSFPQVGEFYEAVGFDACMLVEYAGLNPMGGLHSDGVPKTGCPVVVTPRSLSLPPLSFNCLFLIFSILPLHVNRSSIWQNLRQTLDDLTRNGFSVVSYSTGSDSLQVQCGTPASLNFAEIQSLPHGWPCFLLPPPPSFMSFSNI